MFSELIHGIVQAKEKISQMDPVEDTSLPAEVVKKTKAVFGEALSPFEAVQRILDEVRTQGDKAVRHYTRKLDGSELGELEGPRELIADAVKQVPKSLIQALEFSATRIKKFNQKSLSRSWMDFEEGLGEMISPMERIGIYVPGGSAPLASTVLMTAIPATVAGVREIILTTPPGRDGIPSASILAAAAIAGVHRIFAIGGAQAIGAMAFGTESVPRVDKICGPGNIFVILAKKQVFGQVDIDGLPGPTETVLVVDETARPDFCAADLLAQAEHDALATPIFITTSLSMMSKVEKELINQIHNLNREDIARTSLQNRGLAILVDSLDEALELSNFIAPEHLCLLVKDPWEWVPQVRHAGGLFLGEFSPEGMGDYVAGPSHVMPTGGTARFHSYLGVHQFLKTIPIIGLKQKNIKDLAYAASTLARAEGLTGHALTIEKRLRVEEQKDNG